MLVVLIASLLLPTVLAEDQKCACELSGKFKSEGYIRMGFVNFEKRTLYGDFDNNHIYIPGNKDEGFKFVQWNYALGLLTEVGDELNCTGVQTPNIMPKCWDLTRFNTTRQVEYELETKIYERTDHLGRVIEEVEFKEYPGTGCMIFHYQPPIYSIHDLKNNFFAEHWTPVTDKDFDQFKFDQTVCRIR